MDREMVGTDVTTLYIVSYFLHFVGYINQTLAINHNPIL